MRVAARTVGIAEMEGSRSGKSRTTLAEGYIVATNKFGMEPSSALASDLGLEPQRMTMRMIGVHGFRFYRDRERSIYI